MVIPYALAKKDSEDAPFNMAQIFYIRLSELQNIKSRAKINGDIETWFQSLTEIHTQISFKLKDEENKKILEKLKLCGNYLSSPMPANRHTAAQMQGMIAQRVTLWLNELDRDIMHHMDAHKMIFPRIEMRTTMEKLREDMGLTDKQDPGGE